MPTVPIGTIEKHTLAQLCTLTPMGPNGLPLPPGDRADVSFVADVTTNEVHTRPAKITDIRVERGSNITDHRERGPQTIVVTALLTEIPPAGAISFKGFPADFRTKDVKTQASPDRPQAILNELLRIDAEDLLFELETDLARYSSCMLESLSFKRNPEQGKAITVDFTAKEVRFAEVQTATLKAPVTKIDAGKKRKNTGNKPATTAKEPDRSDADILIGDKLRGALKR